MRLSKYLNVYRNELDGEGNDLGGGEEVNNEDQDQGNDWDEIFDSLENDDLESEESAETEQIKEGEEAEGDESKEENAEPTPEDDEAFKQELISQGKERQAKRFEQLTGTVSELKKQNEEFKVKAENYDNLSNEIFNRGAIHPDNLVGLVDFFEDFEKGQMRPQSVQLFTHIAEVMSSRYGVDLGQVNPFTNHPDLQQKVDELGLSKEDALQIVQARESQSYLQNKQQGQVQQQTEQQQRQQTVDQALNDVEGMRQKWIASDPDFQALEPKLIDFINTKLKGTDPSTWSERVETAYSLMKDGIGMGVNSQQSKRQTNFLGADGGAVETKKEINSMDDAMDAVFGAG